MSGVTYTERQWVRSLDYHALNKLVCSLLRQLALIN